jgi:membrane-bound lytic murein transglycosylase A
MKKIQISSVFSILSSACSARYVVFYLIGIFFILSSFSGCKPAGAPPQIKQAYDTPLAPGENALRLITDPAQIPDFTFACMDTSNLRQAVANSLNYLNKPSSQKYYPVSGITHTRAVASLTKFAQLLDSGLIGPQLNAAIKQDFDVYMSVGCDYNGTVLYTGYYTPIIEGSLTRTAKFQYPLYKQPADLIKNPDGTIVGRRMPDGSTTKYPTRAQIESQNMLKGQELVWLADPFEVYVAHVQGSAKIQLTDGKVIGVGYAANNGWDYKSITDSLVADGAITRAQLSLASMMRYFKQHPDKVSQYTAINPRFVFFQPEQGAPRGSLNEPVTPMRTIATDKSIFPRAGLAFVATYLPRDRGGAITKEVYSGFALDQDSGGAIRAPGRCDFYVGIGDQAGILAGATYQEGKLYYLFLKEVPLTIQY